MKLLPLSWTLLSLFLFTFSFSHAFGAKIPDSKLFKEVMQKAKEENKDILILLEGTTWCPPCKMMHEEILQYEEYKSFARENYVSIVMDLKKGFKSDDVSPETLEEYKKILKFYNMTWFPTRLLITNKGKIYHRERGYIPMTISQHTKKMAKLKNLGNRIYNYYAKIENYSGKKQYKGLVKILDKLFSVTEDIHFPKIKTIKKLFKLDSKFENKATYFYLHYPLVLKHMDDKEYGNVIKAGSWMLQQKMMEKLPTLRQEILQLLIKSYVYHSKQIPMAYKLAQEIVKMKHYSHYHRWAKMVIEYLKKHYPDLED